MKIELHINGKIELQLMPETAIERAVMATMFTAADKGTALNMSMAEDIHPVATYTICAETK